jgi:hypothetical protein
VYTEADGAIDPNEASCLSNMTVCPSATACGDTARCVSAVSCISACDDTTTNDADFQTCIRGGGDAGTAGSCQGMYADTYAQAEALYTLVQTAGCMAPGGPGH